MIFILDNFDSFTYNLYQYFGELGEEVIVRRRDECTLEDIKLLNPSLLVISPGPCTPNEAKLSLAAIERFKGEIPILGVCLGHQVIGQYFGAKILRSKAPIHGKTWSIIHSGIGVFRGLPNPLSVTRYHSLVIDPASLPEELIVTAKTEEGEIMGVRHRDHPIEGVQFHPEAILTDAGHALLQNAVNNAREWLKQNALSHWELRKLNLPLQGLNLKPSPSQLLPLFKKLPNPFFLDSGSDYPELGRYSFLGASPYLVATGHKNNTVQIEFPLLNQTEVREHPKTLDILDDLLSRYQLPNPTPLPFIGGAVGYFSYDLKDEIEQLPNQGSDDLATPLWRWAWYDGILIYDHLEKQYWLAACGMTETGKCELSLASKRLDTLENLIREHLEIQKAEIITALEKELANPVQPVQLSISKEDYEEDLQTVIEYIYAGDIYQANLTQRFEIPTDEDPWSLFLKLHQNNPAPFAAFLPYEDFQILSSSPERFIQIEANGRIETRPIKGTRPRGTTPEADTRLALELENSLKDRAELTMIIDLERNDLGRICKFGSVKVTDLLRLEKYPTVWHLVSTIEGTLKPNLKPSEIIHGIFPGGSITGAPKIRAMEIIEELEPYKRGVYTGSIGYIGFDGSWDLNIAIRTIVLQEGRAYIHAGGGIVADSIPSKEYEETFHKAKVLFKVLGGEFLHEFDGDQ